MGYLAFACCRQPICIFLPSLPNWSLEISVKGTISHLLQSHVLSHRLKPGGAVAYSVSRSFTWPRGTFVSPLERSLLVPGVFSILQLTRSLRFPFRIQCAWISPTIISKTFTNKISDIIIRDSLHFKLQEPAKMAPKPKPVTDIYGMSTSFYFYFYISFDCSKTCQDFNFNFNFLHHISDFPIH